MRLVALLPTRLKLQYHLHTVTNTNENIQRLHQHQEDVLQFIEICNITSKFEFTPLVPIKMPPCLKLDKLKI